MPLTPQQETAVYNRGGSLLVSAAAGSGKTKVLVERLFSYMEQEGCQVDDFLIITYTKAAAAELRGKIAQELTRRVAERPGDGHLRRQMLRVYQADIKTVDAFCAGLLRENVHLLPPVEEHSLTPDFRVLDEQEAALLRQRVLGRVLEDFYAGIEGDENARLLAETLGAGRDDRALEALVLDLHQKTQSHPHPAVAGGAEAGLGQNAGAPAGHRLRPVSHGGRPAEGGLLVPAAEAGRGGHGGLSRRVQGLRRPVPGDSPGPGTPAGQGGTGLGQPGTGGPHIPPDGSRPGR